MPLLALLLILSSLITLALHCVAYARAQHYIDQLHQPMPENMRKLTLRAGEELHNFARVTLWLFNAQLTALFAVWLWVMTTI